jgi:hypothetical protein
MPLTAEHKRKISEGLKRYHRSCAGNKENKKLREQLDKERKKLKQMIKKKK